MDLEPDHWVWKRERPEYHGGALRDYLRHEDDNGKNKIDLYLKTASHFCIKGKTSP